MRDSLKYTLFWLERINQFSGNKFEHEYFKEKEKEFGKIEWNYDSSTPPPIKEPKLDADKALNKSKLDEIIAEWKKAR